MKKSILVEHFYTHFYINPYPPYLLSFMQVFAWNQNAFFLHQNLLLLLRFFLMILKKLKILFINLINQEIIYSNYISFVLVIELSFLKNLNFKRFFFIVQKKIFKFYRLLKVRILSISKKFEF